MTRLIIGAILAIVIMVSLEAKADGGTRGNDLWNSCNRPQQIECSGYVTGVIEGFFLAEAEQKVSSIMCIPRGVANSQATSIVIKYLRENPSSRHKSASLLVVLAISEAFPCNN